MFSQSLERQSVIESVQELAGEPRVIRFNDLKSELQSASYTQEEIDQIIVEVSHTLPMLDMARKNVGNEHSVELQDVHVEVDVPNRRVTRVIDIKREEE